MYEKVLWIFKIACNEDNYFEKQKNEVIYKGAARIIWKCKNLLYLLKKFENKYVINK